ncbi:unnamed protein product [Cladocopium goreaui]|uniref:Integrase catalytic domain-containing protein n=1 Tax=Cladocopium goreaui TaxID=2562237 RepID=A0A9P1FG62_9DINO|nr:unnamed protein product [Cladocopium goreaui]
MNQPADVFDHEWPPEDVDEYENHYFEEEWPLGETDLHDDLDDPIQAPQSFNVNEPNPGRPDVPVVATPRLSWCCLRCDASNYDWNPEAENWQCTECSGTEFYKTDRPTKIVREHGSWLYLPFGHDAPASSSQKRRRRRMRGKYDPSGDDSLHRETAESEVPTADPVVEVEPRQTHAAQLPLVSHRHDLPATRRSIHASPSAKTSDERLVAALTKALDKKSDSEEWSSLKGPFKGVRWRGGTPPHPPTWSYDKDDLRAYNKYVKKVEIWMLQVAPYMTKKEAALQLYGALQGEAEQELEHTPVSEIYCDDGVQKILSALQAPMEQKQIYQKRRYLHEFENLRRNHGETLRAYVNRFRRVQRSLRSVGIEVSYTYDSESLGARLLDRSGLSHEQQRMLLVGTSQSLAFDQLAEAMVLQFPDYRGAPPILGANAREVSKGSSKGKPSSSPSSTASSSSSTTNSHTSYRTSSTALSSSSGKGGSVKRAFVAEVEQPANDDTPENLETIDEEPQAEEEADQSADSEHTAQEGDDPDLSELAEVLTITAKKLSGLTLGRKWAKSKPSGPRDRASPSDAKKHTHCSACGAKGHWYQDPECPKNQGTSSRTLKSFCLQSRVRAMHQPPPAWLASWRRIVLIIKNVFKVFIRQAVCLINLSLMPRDVLQALPPQVSIRASPDTCDHFQCKRYGNPRGRFAQCLQCLTKWKWNEALEKWQPHGPSAHSSRLRPLPPPSSATIATSVPSSTAATRAATSEAKAKATPGPTSNTSAAPQTQWTSFDDMELHMDHLTEEEQVEVMQIMIQESPIRALQMGTHNWMWEAWANDPGHEEDRQRVELQADQKRWDRLIELGVIQNPDSEIYDFEWNEVDPCEALSTKLAPEYDLDVLQPYDLIYGQDFTKEEVQNNIFKTLRRFRPLLTLMGLDCRHYNLFQLQQGDAPLRQMAASVAEEQLKNNRYFLMRSEVWETPEMERLIQLPGVWTVTCDSGVFGLMVHGHHVAKPITFIGNIPGLDEQLSRRLLPEQRQQCTPIQGKLTRASQAYPEELCRTILEALRRVARELQPQRFCTRQRGVHQALPVQQPTTDLAAWDSVYQHLDAAFSQSSKRPFLIATNSEMGKYIQSLFRIDAIKIQAVASPTTRRIPSNVDEWSTRACCLFFADDDRKVEVEDLDNVRFPKQKFHKTVRYAVFAYGARRELPATSEQQQPEQTEPGPAIVPGLPTDIDFPGTSQQSLSQEVKRTVARLHLNLGHPTSQELCRLLAYEGNVPDMVYQAVRHLRCATCERLKPPQKPRPSTMPSLTVGQFNDELQADICYCRTVTATTFMILGVVDRATGLHQAGILDDRNSETCFQLLHDLWLRPFGLPLRLLCDPDPSFKGMFQHRVQAIGIHLDYCPPEAHHIIGMIERRNSVLRLILERLIDQFAVDIPERCQVLVSAACHAINSQIQTHGRSAYQAVFGRQPRLLDSNFNDPMILATSSSAIRDETNPGLRADLVRNEAIKTLHNLDVSQHLRRALLRKTRKTNIADLQPGQKCAFWRWSRRGGPRKRGTWVIGRFLSWDPSHPGKQAWIRSGATTILATAEQIRAAFGFEDWAPDLQDVAALKNASTSFTDQLLDDRGPEPPDLNIEDDDIFDPESAAIPPTPSMMVPATPVPQTEPPAKPASSSMQPRQSDTVIQQQSTIQVNIDSPTHITNKTMQFQRFGDIPTRSRKHRSRTPNSRRTEVRDKPVSQPPAELPPAEAPTILPPAATMTDEQPSTLTLPQPTEEQQSLEHMPPQTVSQFLGQGDTILDPTEPEQHQPGPTQGSTAQSSASQTMQHDVVPETPQVIEVEDDSTDNMLPQKRTFDSLITLRPLGHNKIQRVSSQWDGSPLIGFGPKSNRYHKAYLTTHQRKQDVLQENKPPEEPDTTDDSSSDETEQVNKPQTMQLALKTSSKQKQSGKTALQPMQPAYKQGMTRQEVKALDREIPWRTILSMPPSYVDKFLAAIDKEAVAWQQWQSVEPLSDKQAQEVFSDPVLSKRILPSRACYRDKACGIGDVVAKCRIVALGHLDPDLQQLSRNASTPGRIAEHIMFLMIVSGSNRCLFDTQQLWITWIGDAKTAFLQGVQDPQERDGPLFMRPPRDGLISRTNHWTAAL